MHIGSESVVCAGFTRAANQLIGDLLSSGALANAPTQPAILHVGEIRNDTQTYFDTDLLMQGMKRDLLATNRVRISTTAGPGGKGADSYAQEVRQNLEGDGKQINRPRPYFLFLVRLSKRLPVWKK